MQKQPSKAQNATHTKILPKKILIFASENGSNFEAIAKHFQQKAFKDKVNIGLLTDNKNAYAIQRAKRLNIPYFYVPFENLYDFLKPRARQYDLYVLAGYMRILPEKILNLGAVFDKTGKKIQNKFINIHPSLLPDFKGKNAIQQAFKANAEKTGITIHFVEKKVDSGKIITQKSTAAAGKTLAELEKSIHEIEHRIYPEIIENLLFKKNVLLFGGGAREHALAQKLLKSPFLDTLYLANPNDGFKRLGKTVKFPRTSNPAADYDTLAKNARALNIDLLVIGPENPLFEGISDIFQNEGIKVIGANKKWAALEGSKSFAKIFMTKNGIKTADYKILTDCTPEKIKETLDYFKAKSQTPPVIKADGAALGKGVYLPETFEEAEFETDKFLKGEFGEASKKVVLEERLFGKEVSLLSFWDGKTLVSFPPAQDYKRLLDNNKGKNTGGMGSFAPVKISVTEQKRLEEYQNALKTALLKENADFKGIIYSGLMLTKNGVYVLEYNMRFGDPETQVLLELLDTDLLYIFLKTADKKLNEIELKFNKKKAYCVVLASEGYPDSPKKGAVIKNLEAAEKYGCKIYFAGVKSVKNPAVQTYSNDTAALTVNGGRVLSIVKSAYGGKSALDSIYKTAAKIEFEGKIYRKDIGKIYGKKP